MEIIHGKGVSGSMVGGRLCIIRHASQKSRDTFTDIETETDRFRKACEQVKKELSELQKQTAERTGKKEADIFAVHRMMIDEEDFRDGVSDHIKEGKTAAEAALLTGENLARLFASMDSPYMQARAADIRSVSEQIAGVLNGQGNVLENLRTSCIIAADDLSPAETVRMDKTRILGFVTETGSENSHTAILARTMDIPAVVAAGRIDDRYDGAECILDGKNGILYIEPEESIRRLCLETELQEKEKRESKEQYRGKRCITPAGKPLYICANAGGPEDVLEADENDAEGIGLFRSEFLFMRWGRCPTEEEQFDAYKETVCRMGGRETIIRTLDAGADKQLSWIPSSSGESNPALGLRAVRLCLRHSVILFTQLRALYRASAFGPIAAMIPMITIPEELKQVNRIAAQVRESLTMENIRFNPEMPIGIMIETPSAALYAEELAELCDFFSIGTNDLIQYTLAADRENPEITYLTKPLPDSVLRLMEITASAAVKAGIPVGICGELGTEESLIPFFLHIGITKLSVPPNRILQTRGNVLNTIRSEKLQKTKEIF
ncbi:MAG: phosphoenolpyruvate--protein phosphotransferase [Ruminococcaceae bacterium]|nr:phosphoenolpyruvate--protein phosphotransferase [Oscillospiraceae bacterium]